MNLDRLASRKFILATLTLIAATSMLYLDHLTAILWRDVVLGTVGVYIAGNVAQKVWTKEGQ